MKDKLQRKKQREGIAAAQIYNEIYCHTWNIIADIEGNHPNKTTIQHNLSEVFTDIVELRLTLEGMKVQNTPTNLFANAQHLRDIIMSSWTLYDNTNSRAALLKSLKKIGNPPPSVAYLTFNGELKAC